MTAIFEHPRGDTLHFHYDLDVDCTGWTPTFTIKPIETYAMLADGAATVTATVGTGVTVTTAATGIIDVEIAAAVMAGLLPGDYAFDLQIVNGSLRRTALVDGKPACILRVLPDVTRS